MAILYTIGVGPGDHSLITLKALERLKKERKIACIRTNKKNTVALNIVRENLNLDKKEIIIFDYSMTKDKDKRLLEHISVTNRIIEELDKGENLAFVVIGDASLYSSSSYHVDAVIKAGHKVKVIPGITSFCAAAAAANVSLTKINKDLHIIPIGYGSLDKKLELDGTKVLMKIGKHFDLVKEKIREKGLMEKSILISRCGLEDEKIIYNLDEATNDDNYLSLILIRG